MSDQEVRERIAAVRSRIARAAVAAGRSPDDVQLVAVSKTFPAEDVRAALEHGISDFGENRAVELKEKAAVVPGPVWHFIGPLQTNKVRHVVGVARLIHSVDRLGLAEAISRRARSLGVAQDVLIEVNLAGEPTKHGIEPSRVVPLAQEVHSLDGIVVRGLMAIPPQTEDAARARSYFALLADLRSELSAHIAGATELSMGMSFDLEPAIQEGATMVRVGQAIFGPRKTARGRDPREASDVRFGDRPKGDPFPRIS